MKVASILQLIGAVGVLMIPRVSSAQDVVLPLSGEVSSSPPDHERIPFSVPEGISEIQIEHDDQSDDNILDWGLEDPNGFRGWGGGNQEPAIVGELAASRSYLAGPLPAGTWNVVIGKAKIEDAPATYAIEVTLRQTPTLAPQTERAPYQAPSPLATEARWYAGDFHVHSLESGDARPPLDEILDFAASRGLDFVVITDHNTNSSLDYFVDAQSRHPDVLLIPGVEWTSYAGHAGGIGATQWVDHKVGLDGFTAQQALEGYEAQNAIFSINHPTLDLGNLCIGCAWDHDIDLTMIGGVEIGNASTPSSFVASALQFWDEVLDAGGRPAALGGSDDHRAGVDLGAYQSPIGTPLTMVYANELSVSGILTGVRAGQTVVRLEGPDDPMVELSLPTPDAGSDEALASQLVVAVVTQAKGTELQFVTDGVAGDPIAITSDPFETELSVARSEERERRVRVQVSVDDRIRTVTSHVFVAQGEAGAMPDPPAPGTSSAEGGGCGCRVGRQQAPHPAIPLAALVALAVLGRLRRRTTAVT